MTEPALVYFYFDIMNATITPLPPGVPGGVRLRAVGTDQGLTVMWLTGGQGAYGRVDLPLTEEDMAGANFEGGQVGPYTVTRNPNAGCGTCHGGSALMQIPPFPRAEFLQRMPPGQIYGVPPQQTITRWYRP